VASRSLRDFRPFLEGLAGKTHDFKLDPALIESASTSIGEFADYLDSLSVEADPGFALGRENLIRLLELKHLIREDPEDLADYATHVIAAARKRLEELPASGGRLDFDTTAALALTPEGVLDLYRVEAESVLAFIARKDLMTAPAEGKLEIAATPEFLKGMIPGHSYLPPGPLDETQVGRFYVPLPAVFGPEDGMAYQRDFESGRLAASVIHEAYPGHHLQITTANRAPSLARKLQANVFAMEGWALYCEELIAEQGYGGPDGIRRMLEGTIFRAARVIVDIRLQLGQYSLDEAIEFMINETGAPRSYLEKEVRRYAVEPAQAMSYIIGKREIEELRDDVRGEMGEDFTLKTFHDNLLSCGSIQPYLLRACAMSRS
jgi:hypothetical protein